MKLNDVITEAANPAQQAAIAIAKKKQQGIAEVGPVTIGSKLPKSDTETFGIEPGRGYYINNPKDWKKGDRPRAIQQLIPTQDKKDHIRSRLGKHAAPVLPESGMAEDREEYRDEAGMARTNLITIARAAQGLLDTVDQYEDLPEWVQEKIAKVEQMLVVAWDYLKSQEAQGIDPRITESICTEQEAHAIFDDFEQVVAARGLTEDIYDTVTDEDIIRETAAWRRKEGKSKKGGLNAKGVASYRRENPGSKLQMAVTTKPSKLKPGSKAAKRRKPFCARMSGVKGPMKKPNGKPTRKALALRKWNC